MKPSVVVSQDGRRPLHLLVDEQLDIGRECDGLLVSDERVSRQHLRLEVVGEQLRVIDLGSSNGTFIDGVRLSEPITLEPETTVRLGSISIRLAPADNTPHSAQPPPSQSRRTVHSATAATVEKPGPLAATPDVAATVRQTGIQLVAQTVMQEGVRPPSDNASGDDTVTIMFSDIESSTRLATSLGDALWYRRLFEHNELVERCVASGGGHIIKSQGDGYMITFTSARRALLTAAAIQAQLAKRHRDDETDDDAELRVRIGCHTGEAIRHGDGDLFGQHVIIAARVAEQAEGGQILVSDIAKEITAARGDLRFGSSRSVSLKGITGARLVHELHWHELPAGALSSPRR